MIRAVGARSSTSRPCSELARQTIAPYAATKGGVKKLTRGMGADWARHGIQVNGLVPGTS